MLYVIIDGSCIPNPSGICAYAFIIKNGKNNTVYQASGRVGAGQGYTNNVGEYHGLVEALKWFSGRPEKILRVVSDSMLVIKQMNGEWKVNKGAYIDAYLEAHALNIKLRGQGKEIMFNWVPREYTAEADRLASQVALGK